MLIWAESTCGTHSSQQQQQATAISLTLRMLLPALCQSGVRKLRSRWRLISAEGPCTGSAFPSTSLDSSMHNGDIAEHLCWWQLDAMLI